MGRPYEHEMAKLPATFEWSCAADLGRLVSATERSASLPLRSIGSGGSFSVAHLHAVLHTEFTGLPAMAATPLESIRRSWSRRSALWFLSAGGRNIDVRASVEAAIRREPEQLTVVCGSTSGPLVTLVAQHDYVDFLPFSGPAGRDGFLATNSALMFATLLARSYETGLASPERWSETEGLVRSALQPEVMAEWRDLARPVVACHNLIVLHGPATSAGAVDIESKFTEAGLANVQTADYRNFAHGRHHWIARHGATTGVLALASSEDGALQERTLDVLPPEVPVARIGVAGLGHQAALTSLVSALAITGVAGEQVGLDPGRPHVPEFGRSLYRLTGWRPRQRTRIDGLSIRGAAAIERKSGVTTEVLKRDGELKSWTEDLDGFCGRLEEAAFDGIVFDFDGTIVDTRRRFEPPQAAMVAALIALLDEGVSIGFATGRGRSVTRDLRSVLPDRHWGQVTVGYYNGTQVAALDSDEIPVRDQLPEPAIATFLLVLEGNPRILRLATIERSASQITIAPNEGGRLEEVFALVQESLAINPGDVQVLCSGHSVDVLPRSASKLAVLQAVGGGPGEVLRVGDQGQWPGNDYQLLGSGLALSVDAVNADRGTCWNLGSPGQRGPAITLEYLGALRPHGGRLSVVVGALR